MTISNWRPVSSGARKGNFDLEMPSGMTICGCALVEGKSGLFISLPQRTYLKDGETKYADIIKFDDKSVREKFNLQVIDALRKDGCIS